jgi:hypothetical protein
MALDARRCDLVHTTERKIYSESSYLGCSNPPIRGAALATSRFVEPARRPRRVVEMPRSFNVFAISVTLVVQSELDFVTGLAIPIRPYVCCP